MARTKHLIVTEAAKQLAEASVRLGAGIREYEYDVGRRHTVEISVTVKPKTLYIAERSPRRGDAYYNIINERTGLAVATCATPDAATIVVNALNAWSKKR